MPRPHPRRAVLLHIERWASQNSHEKSSRLLRRLLHIGWKEAPDRRLLQFSIKVRHHFEDIVFAHDSIDCTVGTRTLRRPAGRCINCAFHMMNILTKGKKNNCNYSALERCTTSQEMPRSIR